MTTQAQTASVRTQIVVEAPIERAFRVFVDQFDRIKPREHNLLAVDVAETVLEPRAGGRIYDRGVDGSECQWAEVLAYEPPDRLSFSWLIDVTWRPEADPSRASEVEVRFSAETPERTRVELEHKHLDRHGDGWQGMRDAVGSPGGWNGGLQRYAQYLRDVVQAS